MTTGDRFVSGVTSEPLAASAPAGDAVAWMRDVGQVASDGQYDECLIVCSKGDPGSFPVYASPSEPSPSSRSETAWQPIETAPHNTSVLLGWRDWRDGQWCVEVGAATTGQRYDNGYSNISQHGSATHWQSLPSEGPL